MSDLNQSHYNIAHGTTKGLRDVQRMFGVTHSVEILPKYFTPEGVTAELFARNIYSMLKSIAFFAANVIIANEKQSLFVEADGLESSLP